MCCGCSVLVSLGLGCIYHSLSLYAGILVLTGHVWMGTVCIYLLPLYLGAPLSIPSITLGPTIFYHLYMPGRVCHLAQETESLSPS